MQHHKPILIVGMARSGTTLVSHILGSLPGVHMEEEPHALWKSGNYKYFNDEEYDITPSVKNYIRKKLTENLGNKTLVEKSPINTLRPDLVHAVFPEAKIVYVERDPVRCIYSNYSCSLKKESFKMSIILKKYFLYAGTRELPGAISYRKLFQQISLKDVPHFFHYTGKMFYLRQFGTLPYGPKLKNFKQIVKDKGLIGYHAEVYKRALKYKLRYIELFGDNLEVFKMENIMAYPEEIKRMVEFVEISYPEKWGEEIRKSFSEERVRSSAKKRSEDKEIEALLVEPGLI